MILSYLLILMFFLLVLGKSTRMIISGIEKINALIKTSYFLLGFSLIGFLTSMPEFAIGMMSAIAGIPSLSLGNLMGGSFVLFSLVTGLLAVFYHGIQFEKNFSYKKLAWVAVIILLPAIFLVDKKISQLEGLVIILAYLYYFFSLKKYSPLQNHQLTNKKKNFKKILSLIKAGFLIIFGAILLLTSSSLVVGLSEKLINRFNITPFVLGLIILSIGTNLPEISIALLGNKKRKKNIALGTILGSAAVNSLIIGMVSLLRPIIITDFLNFLLVSYFLILGVLVFLLFAKTKNFISPIEGTLLIILYLVFLASQIFLSISKVF